LKIAVVTGASSGMGREFARAVDREEKLDEIWLIARRRERLETLAGELRTAARILPLDLLREESFAEYQTLLEQSDAEVMTLCNISGFGRFATFAGTPVEDCLDMIDLNARALVQLTHMTLPFMPRGSRVINLDSLSAFQPVPYINVYAATKAFVLSFSRALNVELAPRGIRVLAVSPGWVRTEFFEHAVLDADAVTYFNKIWEPEDVVRRALKDFRKGKDVSIYGFRIRAQVLACKLLPHRLVMRVWMWQQKH